MNLTEPAIGQIRSRQIRGATRSIVLTDRVHRWDRWGFTFRRLADQGPVGEEGWIWEGAVAEDYPEVRDAS